MSLLEKSWLIFKKSLPPAPLPGDYKGEGLWVEEEQVQSNQLVHGLQETKRLFIAYKEKLMQEVFIALQNMQL